MMRGLLLLFSAALMAQTPTDQTPPADPTPIIPIQPPTAPATPAPGVSPLTWEEVEAAVVRAYPPLLAALQEAEIANGELLQAEGRFDLSIKAGYEKDTLGYYRNDVFKVGVDQPTTWQGVSVFSGYQLGRGSFPTYEGKLQTDSLGEYKTGVRVPLFRDRALDSRRAELGKARIGQRLAALSIDQQRLAIRQSAMRRYFDWVAAGQRLQTARSLLEIAVQRDRQLKEASRLGQIPSIDVVDNEKAILTRRAQTVELERYLQQAAIELSLFYRDSSGQPVLADASRLPQQLPQPAIKTDEQFQADLGLALQRRPELGRIEAQLQQNDFDRRLAQNQTLPGIDLFVSYTRENGDRLVRRGPNDLTAALTFDLPLQRRQARGKQAAAEAKGRQLELRSQFAKEQVTAEVRDAFSALNAASQRAAVLQQEVAVAQQLEQAERTRFDLGEGTLFLVNLREQSTFDTALRHLAALNDYARALAQYQYAIAALNSNGS